MQDYCGDHVEITSRQYRVLYSDSAIRVRHRAYTGSFFALLLQTKLASPVGCRSPPSNLFFQEFKLEVNKNGWTTS